MTIEIAGRPIGVEHAPFVITEMSGNHNQSLERALAIVEAGAHAIKPTQAIPDSELSLYWPAAARLDRAMAAMDQPPEAADIDALELHLGSR